MALIEPISHFHHIPALLNMTLHAPTTGHAEMDRPEFHRHLRAALRVAPLELYW